MNLALIAVAAFVFVLTVGIGVIVLWKRRKKNRQKAKPSTGTRTRPDATGKPPESNPVRKPSAQKLKDAGIPRIAVSIPSYRDPELRYTLFTLFKGATHPHKVTALVLQQSGPDDANEVAAFKHLAKENGLDPDALDVRHTVMNYMEARGPAFARAQIEREHLQGGSDFDYLLMVDSHTLFRQGWDSYLVQEHRGSKEPERTVLSTYAPNYVRERRAEFVDAPEHPVSHYMYPASMGADGMPRYKSQPGADRRLPAIGWAAGFSFAPMHVHHDVRYTSLPHFFFGEEFVMHARLFTHGYDVFVPPRTPLYTAFDRSYRPVVWKDLPKAAWERGHYETLQGIDHMLEHDTKGRYALGRDRTLKQFLEFVGINYYQGSVREVARLVLAGKAHEHPPVIAFKGSLTDEAPSKQKSRDDPFGGADNEEVEEEGEDDQDDVSSSSEFDPDDGGADSGDGSGSESGEGEGSDPFA